MRTLLFGAGKGIPWLVLLCCACALALPNGANGQAAIQANISYQSIVNPPPQPPTPQVKGSGSVTGLPANTMAVTLNIKFQKKANGAPAWANILEVNQICTPVAGTANYDTGWQNLTPAPAQGDQYRILVSGSYITGPPDNKTVLLNAVGSLPIKPVP